MTRSSSNWWTLEEPTLSRLDKTLCGLEWKEPYWVGSIHIALFRPEGLLVSNAPPGSMLVEWMVGNQRVLPVGPAAVFLSVWSAMEEIESRTKHRSAARPHFPAMEPSMTMRLKLVGPDGAVLGPPCEPTVWGVTPNHI